MTIDDGAFYDPDEGDEEEDLEDDFDGGMPDDPMCRIENRIFGGVIPAPGGQPRPPARCALCGGCHSTMLCEGRSVTQFSDGIGLGGSAANLLQAHAGITAQLK